MSKQKTPLVEAETKQTSKLEDNRYVVQKTVRHFERRNRPSSQCAGRRLWKRVNYRRPTCIFTMVPRLCRDRAENQMRQLRSHKRFTSALCTARQRSRESHRNLFLKRFPIALLEMYVSLPLDCRFPSKNLTKQRRNNATPPTLQCYNQPNSHKTHTCPSLAL